MRIIIVASSKYKNFDNYTYNEGDYLIGIEDGAYEIIKKGLNVDLSIGDFDTTSHYDCIVENVSNIIKYPKEKDEIDLELAIKYVNEKFKNQPIYIFNATSGRLDHELVTIKLLIKYRDLEIHLMNSFEEVIYINNNYVLNDSFKRFSLIPFEKVELEVIGSKYELEKSTLSITDCFTSSNETKDIPTYINIYSGGVILVKEV